MPIFSLLVFGCNSVFELKASNAGGESSAPPVEDPTTQETQSESEQTESGQQQNPLDQNTAANDGAKTDGDPAGNPEDAAVEELPNPIDLISAPPAKIFQSDLSFAFATQPELTEYRFVLRSGSYSDCSGAVFGPWLPFGANINFTDSDTNLGPRTLCIEGRDADGNRQISPTLVSWERVAGGQPNWVTWTKQTPADAFLKASAISGDYNLNLNEDAISRVMRAAVFDNKVWFTGPCKANSGSRWSLCLAKWDGVSASAEWIDGDLITAGYQPLINALSLTDSGTIVGNHLMATGYQGPDNKFYGFGIIDRNSLGSYKSYTFIADDPTSVAGTSYELGSLGQLEVTLNDSSWQGATDRSKTELISYENVLYFYRVTSNAPTNDNNFISVVTSTDGTTFVAPTNFILSGYNRVFVAIYGSSFHMIAQDRSTKIWYYIPGTSPSVFENAARHELDLENDIAGAMGWDSVYYKQSSTDELKIIGFEALNGKLYLFYLAGDFDYPGAPPLNGGRGVGYFSVNLQ